VGIYVTTGQATGAALANYSVTYVATGSFSTSEGHGTVTAGRGTKAYGASDPPDSDRERVHVAAALDHHDCRRRRAPGRSGGSYTKRRRRRRGAARAGELQRDVCGRQLIQHHEGHGEL